jgi:hypothetical protein
VSQMRAEAEHIIGHVLQGGDHTPDGRGYCTHCVGMILCALEAAYARGRRARYRDTQLNKQQQKEKQA